MVWQKVVFICFLTLVGFVLSSSVTADEPPNKILASGKKMVFLIEQHGSVIGAQLIYLTPDAVRIDCTKKGTIILCKAPDYKVCSYSLVTRKYYETTLSQYVTLVKTILVVYGLDLASCNLQKTGEAEFFGHRCSTYRPVEKTKNSSQSASAKRYRGIWLGDDFKIADQCADLLDKEIGLPSMHKVVLKVDYIQDNFNTHALTTTYSHERVVPANWFDLPPGLTRAKNNVDVYPGDTWTQFVP